MSITHAPRPERKRAGGGGSEEPHAAVALVLVVLGAKAAPVSERLGPLPGGRVEEAVDSPPRPRRATEAVPGSVFIGCPSRRVGEHRAAAGASDVPTARRRCRPQPGEWAGRAAAARSSTARESHDQQHRPHGTTARPTVTRVGLIAQMSPSPSLGPPLLSESPSPPLFWGMPLLAGGAGFATGGAGLGAGFGAGWGAGFGAGWGFAAARRPVPPDATTTNRCRDPWALEIWLPAGETANQAAPNAVRPWPVVWPGFVSLMNR